MKKEQYIKRIAKLLNWIKSEIKTHNILHYFDINITSETFFADLLNIIFNYNLKNLNQQKSQAPYVDLYDAEKNIYIQVTSQVTAKKIKDTVKGFENSKHCTDKKTTLFILLLNDKLSYKFDVSNFKIKFDIKSNILDINDLIIHINNLELNKVIEIKNYLETNLDSIDGKEDTICSEEETIIDIIETLSQERYELTEIPSQVDPELKLFKRFKKFSDEIIKQYVQYYILYGLAYSNIFNLITDEITLKVINNYLKSESMNMLRNCNYDPLTALNNLVIMINNLLSSKKKVYDKGAIRFFLIHQIIECNLFPNEVEQNEYR